MNWGLLVGFFFSQDFLNYEALGYLVKGKVFIHHLYLPVLLELASPQQLTGVSSHLYELSEDLHGRQNFAPVDTYTFNVKWNMKHYEKFSTTHLESIFQQCINLGFLEGHDGRCTFGGCFNYYAIKWRKDTRTTPLLLSVNLFHFFYAMRFFITVIQNRIEPFYVWMIYCKEKHEQGNNSDSLNYFFLDI